MSDTKLEDVLAKLPADDLRSMLKDMACDAVDFAAGNYRDMPIHDIKRRFNEGLNERLWTWLHKRGHVDPVGYIRSFPAEQAAQPAKVGSIRYDDSSLMKQYAEKAKTLIGFVKAPVTFNFAVHELLVIFKRFDVLQVPIAARLDSMEKYETLGQELTLEYFLRKLMVEKYGETDYRNQMQARKVLLSKLYATGLFLPENARGPEYLCTIPPQVRTRPFIFTRKVQCIRLADHVIEKLKQN